jgi:hypothetical protein
VAGRIPQSRCSGYETQKQKRESCDQHHNADGTVKKEQPKRGKKEKKAESTRVTGFAAMQSDEEKRSRVELTVIFTVSPDAQAPGLDSWKTKSNGFAQSGGIDVRYSVLVANPSVREIEPLPRDIAIGVRGIVRRKPANMSTTKQKEGGISMSRPGGEKKEEGP